MKKILIFLLLFSVLGFAPDKLKKTKVAEGVTILLPEELSPMTPDDIALRSPSVRSPLAAFTGVFIQLPKSHKGRLANHGA
jgi:hypothetical protein